ADLEVPRRLVLNGLIYEEKRGLQSVVRGACWTDPLAEPPAISFTPKTGPDAGKPRQGIYRLEGQTLTVCLPYPDHPRPTALQIQPDVQQVRVYRCPDKGESRTPTWLQRVVWGTFFAACALCLCGLPNADKQPLGLILWTAGGAILGAVNAGSMTRAWR